GKNARLTEVTPHSHTLQHSAPQFDTFCPTAPHPSRRLCLLSPNNKPLRHRPIHAIKHKTRTPPTTENSHTPLHKNFSPHRTTHRLSTTPSALYPSLWPSGVMMPK